jgi:hypothetical protein
LLIDPNNSMRSPGAIDEDLPSNGALATQQTPRHSRGFERIERGSKATYHGPSVRPPSCDRKLESALICRRFKPMRELTVRQPRQSVALASELEAPLDGRVPLIELINL